MPVDFSWPKGICKDFLKAIHEFRYVSKKVL